ncbi:hypothetical protein [Celeribacter sp.]|uniref:hypothetical protein n=1 Tax=Celeribacter sp. TaxID=1890673 RepID=UPI003A8E64AD
MNEIAFTWMSQIDSYREQVDFSFWSEPVNAITNLAFVLAALYVWPRTKGLLLARVLAVILFLIGLGSFAFHTTATRWGEAADVTPILAFILTYVFAATRDFFGLGSWWAALAAVLFVPFAVIVSPVFLHIGMGSSAAYAPVPVLIVIYAALLRRRAPATARGMVLGAAVLCISLGFRMLDAPIYATVPMGTHFMWHFLNSIMLAHMIAVYVRHMRRHA